MSLLLDAPHGVQEPRLRHAPRVPDERNSWREVVDLAAAYGLNLDQWQQQSLQAILGETADGDWVTPQVGISVPRQNGKGALIEALELAGLLLFGEREVVHSAHEYRTAIVGFQRIKSYFENYDDLRKLVRRISISTAREFIELKSGQMLRFSARSKSALRGFSVDRLILDEAQELSETTWAAILPTMAARPNAQVLLFGTPPSPEMNGEVFERFRARGAAGDEPRMAWLEWSAAEGCDLDEPTTWAEANPALGIRISLDAVRDERASMDDQSFMRERLGMWSASGHQQAIDLRAWEAAADETSKPVARLTLAVDISPLRDATAIALAGVREDGRKHVEIVMHRGGVGWIVGWIVERWKANKIDTVVIDAKSPAAVFIDELRKKRVRVTVTDAKDMATACAQFQDAVEARNADGGLDPQLAHIDQPQLLAGLENASRRIMDGGQWAWNRRSAKADITTVVAATLAVWGVEARKVRRRADKTDRQKKVVRVL